MRTTRRLSAALVALVTLAGLTAACAVSDKKGDTSAGGGSIKTIDSLKGAKIKVGSKEFDEQLVLGQIAILALKAAGASPVDKTNITGTDNVRKALTGGDIDLYWEYTGTGYVDVLKQSKPISDPVKLYDTVKSIDAANKITWWARSPANDTYAIAANAAAAKKLGITTISDYAKAAKSKPSSVPTCVGPEFKSRDDGFPGVEKAYGFTLPSAQLHVLNDSVVYPTTGKGSTCVFGSVASTDGRVASNNLTILTDDKHFFPVYNPAITIRSALASKYPQLENVFVAIAAKLTSATLTSLNKKLSVDGEKADKVARDWLRSEGFIK